MPSGSEQQAVLTDHRHHAGERPAEHVVDHRHGQRADQPPVPRTSRNPSAMRAITDSAVVGG